MKNLKALIAVAVIAYAITLAAPRTTRDFSSLCFTAAVFLAELGVLLHPPQTWFDDYDADFDESTDRNLDA